MKAKKIKAIELVQKFYSIGANECKQCALIAVDEILNECPSKIYWNTYNDETPSAVTFWQEVKQEINKL